MSPQRLVRPLEILFVEDSPSDAGLTMQVFNQCAIATHITWLELGEAALDYLYQRGVYGKSLRPDLMVLDLNLPGVDGREVLEDVKSNPRLQSIPVIVLTTSDDEQDICQAYRLNANCYLTKPIEIQQFTQVIQLMSDFWFTAVRLPLL